MKAKMRRRPDAQAEKLLNRYLGQKRLRSTSKRLAALDDVEARLLMQMAIQSGKVSMETYPSIAQAKLPDDQYSSRKRRRSPRMDVAGRKAGPKREEN